MAFEKVLLTDRSLLYPTRRADLDGLFRGEKGGETIGWDQRFVVYTWLAIMEGPGAGNPQAGWVSDGAITHQGMQ